LALTCFADPGKGFVEMQNDTKSQENEVDEKVIDEVVDEEVVTETVVLTETDITDNVGDVSVEINVEELVAEVEAEHDDDAARKHAVRKRLEEIAEDQSFEETYAIEFDKD
jgi:hypothetical protein